MPQRAIGAVLALAGLAAVVALLLLRVDVRESARRGPRWRRQLLAGGLFLLTSLGYAPAQSPPGGAATATAPASQPGKDLASVPEWQKVVAAWREAGALASSGRSTQAQRKNADAMLKDAEAAIGPLGLAGLLAPAEAGLLREEAERLRQAMYRNPPIDIQVSCYTMPTFVPAQGSLDRLSRRLPLLEQLAESGKARPQVLAKVLETFEADLAILADPAELAKLNDAQRQEARKVRDATGAKLDKIKAAAAGAGELKDRAEWKTILAAWKEIAPLADSGQSTDAQRKSADEKLAAARDALERLSGMGLLSTAEAGLLVLEAERLQTAMYRNPPTDSRVLCYGVGLGIVPAQDSLQRLTQRLPLLEKMAKNGKVNSEVLSRILPSVEADLKVLSDEKLLKPLDARAQAEAQELRKRGEAAVKRLRQLLIPADDPSRTCYDLQQVSLRVSPEGQAQRAALLDRLARGGKIRMEVLARIPPPEQDRA